MKKKTILGFFVAVSLFGGQAFAAETAEHPKSEHWSFDGMFGHYERESLQRGLQVYKEVCSACHGLRLVAFRTLMDLGYSEAEVKAFAAQYEVQNQDPNDEGEMYMRPATPADHFVSPFPNEQAARAANGGAYPPDLSLIIKAREDGPNYVYSILTGYAEPPAGLEKSDTQYFNPYFPGHLIGMPPPLSEDAVTYADGTKATVDQMAHDVVNFLTWASQPKLEKQKSTGLKVMLFLIVMTGVLIAVKKKIWSDVH
jgi:ubiquinol-cytochrome c reductase cytochrome c1 subunit